MTDSNDDTPAEPVTLASLAPLACWVAWQTELRQGGKKPTKIPYDPNTRARAKADVPDTWGTREAAALRAAQLPEPYGLGGVGLELTSVGNGLHLDGVDLDSCRVPDTGAVAPWAQAVIERLASYAEVSPSGTGVKVFLTYLLDDAIALRTALGTSTSGELKWSAAWTRRTGEDHPPAIEVHLGHRYFAVTGLAVPGSTAEFRTVPATALLHLIRTDAPLFASCMGTADAAATDDGADAALAAQERPPGSAERRKRNMVGQDQSRSVAAFRVGAAARRAGADYRGMCEAIRTHPDTDEWFTDKGIANNERELQRIWDKTDPFTGELILSRGAPLESARQLIGRQYLLHGLAPAPVRTLHHQNASFYAWQHSHYAETTPEEMRAVVYRFLDGAMTYNDTKELVAFDPTKARVANVLEATAAEAQLPAYLRPPSWLGTGTGTVESDSERPDPGSLIACRNGLLDLPTRILLPHSPLFYTLNALPFDFSTDAPEPEQWLAFLHTVWPSDPEAVGTLQELFGLALTGDTSHQKAFLIVGPKRSGKGTVARVLTLLLGTANVCSPTLGSLGTNFGLAPLVGKRLAIISDARLSGKADQAVIAERLLAITGEDAQTIDRKYRDAWTGKLDVRFLVLTNELPRLSDASGALASRFVVLKMVRSFYGVEDRGLLARLLPELPGILNWAIAGWQRLAKRGHFVPPASSADTMREMEDLGSPIGAFLRECCVVQTGLASRCDELYRTWCEWCREHGRDHPGTTQTFGRDLAAAVANLRITQPRDEKGSRIRYYDGVGLSPEWLLRNGASTPYPCSSTAA